MPAVNQLIFRNLYPLKAIKNKKDYQEALKSLEKVFDLEKGNLAEYAETLTILIEYYENEHFPIQEPTGIDVIKFLMAQNNLKQKDLCGTLGGKSSVSEIMNGKRPLNIQHIRALSNKFNVHPATFI
jgi:HTH-type transcriptional regulator/antitoxin HigA